MSHPKQTPDWDGIAATDAFRDLVAAKRRFIVPAVIFFVVYYFLLPILCGFIPEFMATPVLGRVNLAYLFALSQFFMAWIIALLYIRAAAKWDVMAEGIVTRATQEEIR
jgi:uncharacterized membrane protein (DUF485 family)